MRHRGAELASDSLRGAACEEENSCERQKEAQVKDSAACHGALLQSRRDAAGLL